MMRIYLTRLILGMCLAYAALFTLSAEAQTTTVINTGGGFCPFNGADGGLRVHVSPNAQFQVERCSAPGTVDRSRQFFFAGELPPSNILFNSMYLRVGNTIIGAQNNAGVPGAQLFREVSTSGGSTLGNGASTTVYAADVGGLTYTVTQTVTYIFPNDFYTVDIEIDVPAANTQQVDFYSWTDLMLDGDDNGQCIEQTTFPRFAGGDNTAGNYFAGYRERDISRSWDSFSCGFFADATQNGDQIIGPTRSLPNTNFTNNIDIGAATHWEVVDTGGTGTAPFQAQFDFIFSVKEATLTKRFGPVDDDNNDTIAPGETTQLTFTLTNVPGNPAVGPINFTDTLPEGVTIVGTPETSQCRGTVSTGLSGTREAVTLTNGELNGGEASCQITLDVTSSVPGEHENTASDVSGLTFAQNQVNAVLTVEAPTVQPFSCTRDVYLSQGSGQGVDLFELLFSGGATPVPSLSAPIRPSGVTTPQDTYNAIGYRTQDGFIYGLNNDEELVRIDANGAVENLGAVTGLNPDNSTFIAAGAVGPDGLYYINDGSLTDVIVIDVTGTPRVVRRIPRGSFQGADIVVDANAFFAYTVNNRGRILRLSLTGASGVSEGTVDTLPAAALPNGTYGAQYLDVDNRMFVSRNSDNMIFEISLAVDPALDPDLPSGTNRAISSAGTDVSRNDGAFCHDERFPIGGDPTVLDVTVFVDLNGNGTQEAGEPLLEGVIVDLILEAGSGTALGSLITDASGQGRINNLSAGSDRLIRVRNIERTLAELSGVTILDQTINTALIAVPPTDLSDAPATFGSAQHVLLQNLQLGSLNDSEFFFINSDEADGDGAEDDGITIPTLTQGQTATITAEVTGTGGFLQGWIDFDGSGAFEAGEQIASDLQDENGSGTISVLVNVPSDAVISQTFARFRWSTLAGLGATAPAPDGEVEDYAITIEEGNIALSGIIFLDNGAGADGIAHDGLLQGAEEGLGGLAVEAIEVTSGNVLANGASAGDGTYILNIPPAGIGAAIILRTQLPGGLVHISNPPALAGQVTVPGEIGLTLSANTDALDFGIAALPRLTESQRRTITPGGSTLFAHTFRAQTQMQVDFSLDSIASSVESVFEQSVFVDTNCNGLLETGEAPLNGTLPAAAGQDICLLVRVNSSAGAPNGATLTFELIAGASFENALALYTDAIGAVILQNGDEVTLGNAGSLELIKDVCNASHGPCNALTGEGFARSNRGLPGDTLIYRIMFEALGPETVDGLVIADRTPAFSALTATAPSVVTVPDGVSCELVTPPSPASGYEGILGWTCTGLAPPGSVGSVSFAVEIAK